jgi:alkanesulfonate monooxygenase SsuD/methylene tetrahydromethanopterin reductase-like flavin-dependent oxidoreductase (luciferase family)
MRIELMIEGQEDVTWAQWVALAGACEEHGVGTLFRSDHYLSVMGREQRGSLDAWTTMAGLAALTRVSASACWSRRRRSATPPCWPRT